MLVYSEARDMAKKKKKGRRRFSFKRGRRTKSKSVPLGMKMGAAVAVLPPVVVPLVDAVRPWIKVYSPGTGPDISTKVMLSFATWIDSLSLGFGLGKVWGKVGGNNELGAPTIYTTETTTPPALFLATSTIGISTMITSAIQSRLVRFAGGIKQVKIMGRRVA